MSLKAGRRPRAQGPLIAIFACVGTVGLFAPVRADQPITLLWPMGCEPGINCFVQNFVDHDSSEAAKDYRCGSRTYNGHDGTDIRLIDADEQRRGISVLASSAGRVLR